VPFKADALAWQQVPRGDIGFPIEKGIPLAIGPSALRADGLGMVLHQAVRGFSLWFGKRPTVSAELRALVEVDLTRA
jgi:shikimate dehydrogenase